MEMNWINLEIKPVKICQCILQILLLHYGQSIFEGMKAFLTGDNDCSSVTDLMIMQIDLTDLHQDEYA